MPNKKKRMREALDYATVILLTISNIAVLALAILFTNTLVSGSMARIYLEGQRVKIQNDFVKTQQAQAQLMVVDVPQMQGATGQMTTDENGGTCSDDAGSRNSCYNNCGICQGIENRAADSACNQGKNDCMATCDNNCGNL